MAREIRNVKTSQLFTSHSVILSHPSHFVLLTHNMRTTHSQHMLELDDMNTYHPLSLCGTYLRVWWSRVGSGEPNDRGLGVTLNYVMLHTTVLREHAPFLFSQTTPELGRRQPSSGLCRNTGSQGDCELLLSCLRLCLCRACGGVDRTDNSTCQSKKRGSRSGIAALNPGFPRSSWKQRETDSALIAPVNAELTDGRHCQWEAQANSAWLVACVCVSRPFFEHMLYHSTYQCIMQAPAPRFGRVLMIVTLDDTSSRESMCGDSRGGIGWTTLCTSSSNMPIGCTDENTGQGTKRHTQRAVYSVGEDDDPPAQAMRRQASFEKRKRGSSFSPFFVLPLLADTLPRSRGRNSTLLT